MKFSIFRQGKNLWKFNNSLLHDQRYIDLVKKTILETKKQYAIPVYNLDVINDIVNSQIQFSINDQLFLETLLTEIRGKTISYSSFKIKQRNILEKKLIKEIDKLESNFRPTNLEDLDNLKLQLENIRKEKMKGIMLRSKLQWSEEGEKPTKYFLSLENKHFSSKIIHRLEKENGETISDQDKILDEVKIFYKNLFTNIDEELHEDFSLDEMFKNYNIKKVSYEDNKKNTRGDN